MPEITEIIESVRKELLTTFGALDHWCNKSLPVRQYEPNHGGWTIDQILEHIILTNHFLLILIEKGRDKALKLAGNAKLITVLADYQFASYILEEVGMHGAFSWIRPEHMEPNGQKTPEVVRTLLQEQLNRCLQVLDSLSNGEGVLYKTTMTVNNLGKLDVYQYVFFLCLHAKRHLTQMAKVEAEVSSAFNSVKQNETG